jgi:hypothetical protein
MMMMMMMMMMIGFRGAMDKLVGKEHMDVVWFNVADDDAQIRLGQVCVCVCVCVVCVCSLYACMPGVHAYAHDA